MMTARQMKRTIKEYLTEELDKEMWTTSSGTAGRR